nr:hypothetical protein [Cytophagales bacterium]
MWNLKSDDSLVNTGYCLANHGNEYIVFQEKATTFNLNLEGLSEPLQAVWFQPYSGKYMEVGKLRNGAVELTPPTSFGAGSVVLHVSKIP